MYLHLPWHFNLVMADEGAMDTYLVKFSWVSDSGGKKLSSTSNPSSSGGPTTRTVYVALREQPQVNQSLPPMQNSAITLDTFSEVTSTTQQQIGNCTHYVTDLTCFSLRSKRIIYNIAFRWMGCPVFVFVEFAITNAQLLNTYLLSKVSLAAKRKNPLHQINVE